MAKRMGSYANKPLKYYSRKAPASTKFGRRPFNKYDTMGNQELIEQWHRLTDKIAACPNYSRFLDSLMREMDMLTSSKNWIK